MGRISWGTRVLRFMRRYKVFVIVVLCVRVRGVCHLLLRVPAATAESWTHASSQSHLVSTSGGRFPYLNAHLLVRGEPGSGREIRIPLKFKGNGPPGSDFAT